MGIIIRQSIKQTIVALMATVIAGAAHLFIYANHRDIQGEAYAILNIGLFLVPILSFGLPNAMIKFYPKFGSENRGFLLNFLVLGLVVMAFMSGVYILFRPWIQSWITSLSVFDTMIIVKYKWSIIVFIVGSVVFRYLVTHSSLHQRIVWPGIFELLWGKTALVVIISAVIYGILTVDSFRYTLPMYMIISVIGMIVYLRYIGVLNLRWNQEIFKISNFREISNYSGYTTLNAFGGMLATRIDAVMVPTMIGFTENGAYVLFLFMASVINLPSRSMMAIASPIISDALAKEKIEEVQSIYSKSALTLMMTSVGLFALIFMNFGDIFLLTGESDYFDELIWVFVGLGLSQIVSTSFRAASQIIAYSKYYKYILFATLFMGVINVVLNWMFINHWMADQPLIGVAVATAISLILYVLLLVCFIKWKFDLWPVGREMIYGISIICTVTLAALLLPSVGIPLIDIFIRSCVFVSLTALLIYHFNISSDINALIDKVISAIKNRDFGGLI